MWLQLSMGCYNTSMITRLQALLTIGPSRFSDSLQLRRNLGAVTQWHCLAIAWFALVGSVQAEVSVLQPQSRGTGDTLFEELPSSLTGIDFVQPIDINHPLKCLYVGGFASPGLAIGDVNGDALPDLFVTGGPVPNRLYIQMADAEGRPALKFRDVSKSAGVDGDGRWSSGVTFADIDNDGDLDIYVCNYDSPNQLFLNETKTPNTIRFTESAGKFGLDLVDASLVAAFGDYDLDGDLDVLVGGYQYVNPAGRPAEPPVVKRGDQYVVLPEFQKYYGIVGDANGKQTFTNVGRRDYLLRNDSSDDGQIRFTNVTKQAGVDGLGVANSLLWWDFNQDGLPDIFIANDFKVPDRLYRNNGDGTFTDVIQVAFPHTTWFSMGSESGDLNNNGLPDLFVSDMAGTTHYRSKVTMGEMGVHREFMKTARPPQYMRNALLVNTGAPRFLEAAYLSGLANSDWTWAVKLADFDNDGWQDVFITNGAARMFNHSDHNPSSQDRVGKTQWDLWEAMPPRNEENLAYRNLGDLQFKEVGQPWGLRKLGMSYAAAYGDLDLDGDLDLVVGNLDEPVSVYRNDTAKRALRIQLVGTKSNRHGLGAAVRIETPTGVQSRYVSPSQGFLSTNEHIVHFGVGDLEQVTQLSITWPSGVVQELTDVETGLLHRITEAGSKVARPSRIDVSKLLFRESTTFPALRHVEQEYDDYARQPLLPYSHSQLGPAIAVGDVDGDGDDDFYHGRAKGAKRGVYENLGRGGVGVKSILSETEFEDMGAVFFDVDRDGDRDLYVVSGSVECEPGDVTLRDRLYLNNGKGQFQRDINAVPDLRDSGSIVCAADYDRDGDLDLFVGGRVVPGAYPTAPRSRLLRNDSAEGKALLADTTEKVADGLLQAGLVTSAVWSDTDRDGWIDLLVTLEWGPVKFFRNEPDDQGRRLVDRTLETGLQGRLGWWNGIEPRDFDNDGDTDYLVSNFGLNTQYQASDKKPELIYYGQFDGSGQSRILEAKFEQEKCFPRRGLSCSSHAMPFVREKVKTFHGFGISTLQEIYTEEKLDESLKLSANTLLTGILVNDSPNNGSLPSFRFQPLPRLAQISPTFGVSGGDFNADGRADVVLAQNFFSPQFETGRMDSGMSQVLLGRDGKDPNEDVPTFEVLSPRESGIIVPGDAKACGSVDFNLDGWPDLLVTVNNAPIRAFEGTPHPTNRLFRVKLIGEPGNLDCVGARVTAHFEGEHPSQTMEVFAGGGYLTQSSSILCFGAGTARPEKVEVAWPDGTSTSHIVPSGTMALGIRMKR